MKVDNKEIGNIKTTNFGALAFDGDDRTQKLYGIKAGTNGEYKEPSKCAAAIWEFEDYTNPVLIPDFSFNNELDKSKFFSFEMESVAIDRNTNNMIVSVNANSPIAGDNGKHPGEDYIYRFSSIEFK